MEKNVRRYSAFIPRWCQAFGDHAPDPGGEGRAVEWLVGADAVGIVVLPEIRRMLTHELLGARNPELEFGARSVRLNQRTFDQMNILGHPGYAALRELLLGADQLHLFLTYHLIHPPGTRIITVARKPPLPLLYKEMAPLPVIVSE
ncbi:MAG: hypothetical protein H6942_09660 [Candidatus Accumulibacter sp.]|mgnify:CR=1 FL=1|uniref:hypothetical protein n=1 Tax=Accumulibacter sp. TaxID=2053492 RepID=UPI001A0EDAA5|nr:hypothetical protein [Accumulibacter sp.]MBE2260151.1 hypothetical protein [Paracoccaceae bacterium]MCB1941766.1 hypothetical protein [Accumulibacter sp.]MCP5248779.1 hypothetical protein [Accumulibacter sp.]